MSLSLMQNIFMYKLLNQLAEQAASFNAQDILHAGATGLNNLGVYGTDLSSVRAAFAQASAGSLFCAFALSIIAMPFAYLLQWKVLYSKNSE